MKITDEQIGYIVSFMLNTARVEMRNHFWYKHDEDHSVPSGYFKSTYKPLDLQTDGDCFEAMFKVVSKYFKDNEELLMMYGRIDDEVIKDTQS